MTNHPSSRELRDALLPEDQQAEVQEHLAICLACRIRYARLAQGGDLRRPTANAVQRIVEASIPVPGVQTLAGAVVAESPEAGEMWRVGRHEALLVWVRRNFRDGAVDVVPVVLDVELADEHTIILPATVSPLSVELAAMVSLRTHVHRDAFIDRIGDLDIAADVEEVVSALRDGRPSLAAVGPRIETEDDVRFEYRQALRDLLAELTPSAWLSGPEDVAKIAVPADGPARIHAEGNAFQLEVEERLPSATCIPLDRDRFRIGSSDELETYFKVAFLDTAVVVATVTSIERAQADLSELAAACNKAVHSSPDVDAICVAERGGDWPSLLFSRASMRQAVELPAGTKAGPVPVLAGLGLMDTLWKHLEGSASAWQITESAPRGIGSVDVESMATRHARDSIGSIEGQGRRAIQEAKRLTWTTLPAGLAEQVSRFVTAVTGSVSPKDASAQFEWETRRDPNSEAE